MNIRVVSSAGLIRIGGLVLVGGALLCLAYAVSYAEEATGPEAALLATDKAWAEAAKAGDVDRIVSFWAEEAVNYFPGRPKVVGKESLRRLVVTRRAQPGASLRWVATGARVAQSGELGYTQGTFEMSADGSDGKPLVRNGYYVCIWERQSDGAWRCIVEISTFRDAEAEPAGED